MEKKYNEMFKVSDQKIKFYNSKTGETHHIGVGERYKYDLRNENTYDLEGNLIEEASQMDNNTTFALFFPKANVLEVKEYLTHHYNFTPNKELFLDYVEHGIMPDQNFVKGGIKGIMNDWIKEKREEMPVHKQKVKEAVIKFLRKDIRERAEEYVSKLNNVLGTKLNFVKGEIDMLKKGIDHAKEMNDKEFNGGVSVYEYGKTNLIAKLEIAEEYKQELEGGKEQSNIVDSKEPKNPYNKIFINGFAYQMFEKLREDILTKNVYADYSFIFERMIKDEYLVQTTHAKLIAFLDENYKTEIGKKYNQFKTSDTQEKKRAYARINNEFKSRIKSIL